MKKADVKIGGEYYAKVTNKKVVVRIDAENASGGWDATNLSTNKKVRIKDGRSVARTGDGRPKRLRSPPREQRSESPRRIPKPAPSARKSFPA